MDKDAVRTSLDFSKNRRVDYFIDNVAESKYGTHAWDESVSEPMFCFILKNN